MPNPDYVVTKVRYDNDHTRITHVKRGTYDNESNKISNPRSEVTRETVVASIENNNQHYTVPPDGEGGFVWGDEVEVFKINRTKFIRTDGNRVEGDNLENLPEY